MMANVEKAFLQISLHEPDQNLTKFLWVKNIGGPPTSDNLVVYRFCQILLGVVSSLFLLAAVLQHCLKNLKPWLAASLRENLYFEDVILTGNKILEARQWYEEKKHLSKNAKMNVREFLSNDQEVQA